MGIWDYLVFTAYLLGVLSLGLLARSSRTSSREFFLARRSLGWFPIGLSVMVTVFSAVNFTAFPGEVLSHGLYVLVALPVFVIVAWPVTRVFIPFFHAQRLTSAYEYLEWRFDRRVRRLGSALFMLWRLFWMATVLYATSRFLAGVSGLKWQSVVLATGSVAIFYTSLGGLRAVVWTDVAQFFVLLVGVVACLLVAWPSGGESVWATAASNGLFRPIRPFDPSFFSFDPTIRITLWSGLIGAFVAFLGRYGADQMVLQRYFAARSVGDARRGFWLNCLSALVALCLLVLVGVAAHVHAVRTGMWGGAKPPWAYLTALFRSLPVGLTGLIASGLVAATMSSLDSGIHACSTALSIDFLTATPRDGHEDETGRRHRAEERRFLGPLLTVVFGVIAVGLAFPVSQLGSLFAVANRVINALGSPLLALILLGMFSRRANSTGVLIGGIVGAVWTIVVSFGVQPLALHYYAVVNLVGTLAACVAMSEVARALGWKGATGDVSRTWQAWREARHE